MVGNNFTWADLHLFFFCSEDFIEPQAEIDKKAIFFHLSFKVLSIGRSKISPNP